MQLIGMQLVRAQAPRRIAFGFGIEGSGKAQILSGQGSRYGLRGSYAAWGALRFLPADERGFITTLNVGYAADEARYNYAPGRFFLVKRASAARKWRD